MQRGVCVTGSDHVYIWDDSIYRPFVQIPKVLQIERHLGSRTLVWDSSHIPDWRPLTAGSAPGCRGPCFPPCTCTIHTSYRVRSTPYGGLWTYPILRMVSSRSKPSARQCSPIVVPYQRVSDRFLAKNQPYGTGVGVICWKGGGPASSARESESLARPCRPESILVYPVMGMEYGVWPHVLFIQLTVVYF